MRVSSSFNIIQAISSEYCIFEYKSKGELKKLRVIKIKISDDVTEILVTNIYDKITTPSQFKELYFIRWRVECKYKELKSSIEIEEFSGTNWLIKHYGHYLP